MGAVDKSRRVSPETGIGDAPRQLIAIRVDARVLAQFRKAARRKGFGYQTLINDVLAERVRKDVAWAAGTARDVTIRLPSGWLATL